MSNKCSILIRYSLIYLPILDSQHLDPMFSMSNDSAAEPAAPLSDAHQRRPRRRCASRIDARIPGSFLGSARVTKNSDSSTHRKTPKNRWFSHRNSEWIGFLEEQSVLGEAENGGLPMAI